MNKIKFFFINNSRLILFFIIFALICFIYNQNNQTLNYILKRGSILEYSINPNTKINEEKLEKKLIETKINYSFIKSTEKTLYLALPIMPKENKVQIFNDISNYIFEEYPNTKLINVKTLNDNYHSPYSSFLKFLGLVFVSFLLWLIINYLKFGNKIFFELKEKTINYIKNKKENAANFIQKSKEKGFGYFLKKILFDESKDENGNEKEIDTTKEIISTILFVIICVIIIRFFIGELRWIPTGSMIPTIKEKDRVFVEKLDFPKKEISRGDILVFYPPETKLKNDIWSIFTRLSGIMCKDIAYIKRAIGMPNDKFEIKYDNNSLSYQVYINDKPLNEPYIFSKTDWTPCDKDKFCGPFVIPKGHYFMMGDNRGNSQDSRFWGTLEENRIIGRATFMFWPIRRINVLKDKYIELNKEKQNNNFIKAKYIINRYEFL